MRSLVVAVAAVYWVAGVSADFTQCLGLDMAAMLTVPLCMELFSTCQVGVNKLNQKLGDAAYRPVSVISASESKTIPENSTKIAMLVQLAPLADCLPAAATAIGDSCNFDMPKVEFYSILLANENGSSWKLEGYKRHSLSDDERAQIVEEYNSGKFYGSKLAIGIFDENNLPLESDSKETAPRTPIAVVAASVSALFCLGLVFHQRRRLQTGYAPIHLSKGGHVQGKKSPTAKDTPEERSLRPADAAGTGGQTFKQETNERFAV
ncbi:hypothetical protein GN958_ATG12907 [Phytophthora infestans]|uniref:Secreted RxLR effector peptide protein n=2 Tax=Phytophthora infestans TaxID=4787 RepID=A0A8S9UG82_PHYIN|nr:hypothetical protein GN958_ATG12907 [Phytophthora infestans]KAI9997097.1 hypothetical protein PInf_000530 [Phytophthora infestans]